MLVDKVFVAERLTAIGGHKMHEMGEDQLRLCYEVSQASIQRHNLQEWETTSHMHWDLEHWMLTLIKT
jgi:hypothetical protein